VAANALSEVMPCLHLLVPNQPGVPGHFNACIETCPDCGLRCLKLISEYVRLVVMWEVDFVDILDWL
jgi:hypothetical protein